MTEANITSELQALDAAHHLHPFTDGNSLNMAGARVITGAKGMTLIDSEGNEILDAMAGLWCVNVGYGREELVEAAAQQMGRLPYYNTFFQTTHAPAANLAHKISSLAPDNLQYVFFANSGSEANDTNLRIVRLYWAEMGKPNKQIVISRHNAYHGSTICSASLGGMKAMHEQIGLPVPGIVHIDQPDWYREGADMSTSEFGIARARQLEKKIEDLGEDNVAAFIAEPVQGAGGVIIPPETYWPEVQRICNKFEVLLIADEVICGFGRLGEWFGSQRLAIRPDLMTIAKGLSSGYAPISGSVVSEEIGRVILGSGEFHHGYTYCGHPVSAAVALKNLQIMQEERIIERVNEEIEPYFAEKWRSLGDHELVGEAVSIGLMASVALTPDKAARAAFNGKPGRVGKICRDLCLTNNLVMRHSGDRMIVSPPLIISKEQVDLLIERAIKSLDETCTIAKAEGLLVAA